jgi:hypothetical protein
MTQSKTLFAPAPGPPCPLPTGAPAFPPGLGFHGVGATFYGVALAKTNYVDGQFPLNPSPSSSAATPTEIPIR